MADNLITLATFQFLPEAEAARLHLEHCGLAAFLSDAETVNMDWVLGNALGYIKLQVPQSQAEAASSELERVPRARPTADMPLDSSSVCCLQCGAALSATQRSCASCGWSYADLSAEDTANMESVDEGENGPDTASAPSRMDSLRSWKRPVLWIMLQPLFVLLCLAFLVVCQWLAGLIRR